jgi:hypothetical protein
VLWIRALKGGVINAFSYSNFPAISVKAASASVAEGASFFVFGMAIQGIAEWADTNANHIVEIGELSNAVPFNTGYNWAFDPTASGGLYTVSLLGTPSDPIANPTFPNLAVNCTIPDRNNIAFGAFVLDSSDLKCDLEITGLSLSDLNNGWALQLFLIGGSSSVTVVNRPDVPTGSGLTLGRRINIGAGGSFSWVRSAGRMRGGAEVNVTFSGTTPAGGAYTGTGSGDATRSLFGFENPNPGTAFSSIYWDPEIQAPNSASAVAPALWLIMASVMAMFFGGN